MVFTLVNEPEKIYVNNIKDMRDALDVLALALTNHNHKWTNTERKLYEQATKA